MGPLMEMRSKHKEEFEKKHGVKLGFMSAFVKVVSLSLCLHRYAYACLHYRPPLLHYRKFLRLMG